MSVAETSCASRLPRAQQGLLALLAGVLIVLLMAVGVLAVDTQRLRAVGAELSRGLAACDPPAAERPPWRDGEPRWLQDSQRPDARGPAPAQAASAPGDAASRGGFDRLQRAALDLGVAVGCFVKRQLADSAPQAPASGWRRMALLRADPAARFAPRRGLPGLPRFQ